MILTCKLHFSVSSEGNGKDKLENGSNVIDCFLQVIHETVDLS